MTKIEPGKTTFRHTHADSNALWVVEASLGRRRGNDPREMEDVWKCVIRDDPDYAGTERLFTGREIAAAVARDQFWTNLRNDTKDFWANRKVGEIFHYENGRTSFVRCEVVADAEHGHALKPIALVGNWKHDLPRWYDSGHFRDGSHWVQNVRNGKVFCPNESSLWEVQMAKRSASFQDPSNLPALDLTAPAPTPKQQEAADILGVIERAKSLLEMPNQCADYVAEYRRRAGLAQGLLAQMLTENPSPADDGEWKKVGDIDGYVVWKRAAYHNITTGDVPSDGAGGYPNLDSLLSLKGLDRRNLVVDPEFDQGGRIDLRR